MPALLLDYQVHGYAAQGFVYTDDNNFFGESSEGSFDYYEAGLNASVQVHPRLTLRRAGRHSRCGHQR